jgi:transglutaminase-like putative cysteine protease
MRALVLRSKKSVRIRETAARLVNGYQQKDWLSEIKKLHAFVRDEIRYVRDIRGVETLHIPERVLDQQHGDCDDKSVLLAALLESIGHPTRFVAVGFVPGRYSHVFVESKIGEKWVPLETTENVGIGWTPKGIAARMVVHN